MYSSITDEPALYHQTHSARSFRIYKCVWDITCGSLEFSRRGKYAGFYKNVATERPSLDREKEIGGIC
jgi:hypothetical protein